MLDENLSAIALKLDLFEAMRDNPSLDSDYENNCPPSNFELTILQFNAMENSYAYGYVNGIKVAGGVFEVVEISKILSNILGIYIPFDNIMLLDNLVFNFKKRFGHYRSKSFGELFMLDTITMKTEEGKIEKRPYTVEKKKADFSSFFWDKPDIQERATQPVYFE